MGTERFPIRTEVRINGRRRVLGDPTEEIPERFGHIRDGEAGEAGTAFEDEPLGREGWGLAPMTVQCRPRPGE